MRRPKLDKFVRFYLSHDARCATELGYEADPDEISARSAAFFTQRSTATACMTPEMEKREGGLNVIYRQENLAETK